MQTESVKKNLISPEFSSTVFFVIFAFLFLIFSKYTLLPLEMSSGVPLLPSSSIALILAAFLGRVFARALVGKRHWFRVFLTGVLMALAAILISGLVLFIRAWIYNSPLWQLAHHWQDYFIILGVCVVMIASVIGVWLVALTGLAAVYFNKRFYPRLMAFDKRQPASNDSSHE